MAVARMPEGQEGWSPRGPVTELPDAEVWTLLASETVGRLGLVVGEQPDIFPINFAVDGRTLVFRTGAGAKLSELAANRHVVLEVDRPTDDGEWSITVKGVATVVERDDEVGRAARDRLPDWIPTSDYVYVRIDPSEVRGRAFHHQLTIGRLPKPAD